MIQSATVLDLIALLSKASEKADKEKPGIKNTEEFGVYLVWSKSRRRFIEIRIGLTEDQQCFIACQCRAALEGKACYHAAIAFHRHLRIVTAQLKEVEDRKRPTYIPERREKKAENIGGVRI
jgi:hypothetical protein